MIPVLIVDASPEFCILIRQTLEETGRYQVTQANSGAEAVQIAEGSDLRLAIVDFRLPDVSGPQLVRDLRARQAGLAVIAIPLQKDSNGEIEELAVNGVLTKPFYLPDLPNIVATALQLQESGVEAPPPPPRPRAEEPANFGPTEPPPPWLADVDRAAQYLTRLTLESSAEGTMLTRGRRLWAYAGQLPRNQVQELTGMIADHWARDGSRGALAKFVRLPGSSDDLMLYATGLPGEIVLSLVFHAETPFGMIRREAHELARALAEIDPAETVVEVEASEAAVQVEAAGPVDSDAEVEEALPLPSDWIPQDEADLANVPFLAGLEELDLPPPDPEITDIGEAALEAEWEAETEVPLPRDWVPEVARPPSHLPFLEDLPPAATGPLPPKSIEPVVSEGSDELVFTAVLVPRFPEHSLTGDLAEQLGQWVERICLAWDWRARSLRVEPDFLQVSLGLLPEVAPAQAIRQLREDLSARILEAYPEFALDLPSGRFWARGYLLTAAEPPESDRIETFIQQTRRAQGLGS